MEIIFSLKIYLVILFIYLIFRADQLQVTNPPLSILSQNPIEKLLSTCSDFISIMPVYWNSVSKNNSKIKAYAVVLALNHSIKFNIFKNTNLSQGPLSTQNKILMISYNGINGCFFIICLFQNFLTFPPTDLYYKNDIWHYAVKSDKYASDSVLLLKKFGSTFFWLTNIIIRWKFLWPVAHDKICYTWKKYCQTQPFS